MQRNEDVNQISVSVENSEPFALNDLDYFRKLKKEKRFIIKDLVLPGTLNMWCSPPKNLKSINSLYAGVTVSSGRDFYGLKTRKQPTLIIDLENPEQEIKYRITGIIKGLKLRKLRLYYMPRGEHVDIFSPAFICRVHKTVEKYGIKLIILDTLRRMSPVLKENEADDVSRFYSLFFAPLRDKFGIAMIFLHHMDKKAKKYRGSTDLQAMVDNSYIVLKTSERKTEATIKIVKDVSRGTSLESLHGHVEFFPDSIEFTSISEKPEETQLKEHKHIVKLIATYIENHGKDAEVSKASVNLFLNENNIDVKAKRSSIARVIKYLRESGKINMAKNGRYSWSNLNQVGT